VVVLACTLTIKATCRKIVWLSESIFPIYWVKRGVQNAPQAHFAPSPLSFWESTPEIIKTL
jgi:hypothetical protein